MGVRRDGMLSRSGIIWPPSRQLAGRRAPVCDSKASHRSFFLLDVIFEVHRLKTKLGDAAQLVSRYGPGHRAGRLLVVAPAGDDQQTSANPDAIGNGTQGVAAQFGRQRLDRVRLDDQVEGS